MSVNAYRSYRRYKTYMKPLQLHLARCKLGVNAAVTGDKCGISAGTEDSFRVSFELARSELTQQWLQDVGSAKLPCAE